MTSGDAKPSTKQRHLFGLLLLLIVNVLWVAAGEITRFIFVDLNFKRPFLTTYIKLCMLTVYLFRYCLSRSSPVSNDSKGYNRLSNDNEAFDMESLTPAEFEPVAQSEESDSERSAKLPRRVRFSEVREVRHMPVSLAEEALRARLPYSTTRLLCSCSLPEQLKYTAVLSPLWIICTLSYQGSLMFSTVSSVNLVSASSSLFVLVFSACCGSSPSDRFTVTKALLVVTNAVGVALVSEYSLSIYGTSLALFSSICYAIYLVFFSYCQSRGWDVNMNLIFGVVGSLTALVYSPLLISLHYFSIEPLFPLPDRMQLMMLILNGLVGTVFSDYLWLQATVLTSSLAASISLSMSIPLSLLADTVIRSQPPSTVQLIAAVPITISFLGAAFLQSGSESRFASSRANDDEQVVLIDERNCEEEEQW